MTTPARADRTPVLARRGRVVGIVVWSAFLAAAFATMLCFALLDPKALIDGNPPGWWDSRMRVYAIGFFFFWFVGIAAASLAAALASPARRG